MRALLLCGCASLLVAPHPAFATTYHVSPDGSGDYPTIQAAIFAAAEGDTVEMACGTYYEHDILLQSGVCVRGESQTPCVIVDARQEGRGFFGVGLSPSTVLEGIAVTGGSAVPFFNLGGGAYLASSDILIRRCAFIGNLATGGGGGLYCGQSAPRIEQCEFRGNASDAQGGGVRADASGPQFVGCSFVDNHAPVGGGLWATGAPALVDCTFSENVSHGSGGAIELFGSFATLIGCRFSGNGQSFPGGYVDGAGALGVEGGNVSVEGCVFQANSSPHASAVFACGNATCTIEACRFEENAGRAGCVVVDDAHAIIRSSLFVRNVPASELGGAVFATGGSTVTLSGCTVVENVGWAGLRLWDANVGLDHCVIAFGSGGPAVRCHEAQDLARAECCDLFGNSGGDWVDCVTSQDGSHGNISADPLFCDLNSGDLSLSAVSPCAPEHSGGCGLIGALGVVCGPVSVEGRRWGLIKALYR